VGQTIASASNSMAIATIESSTKDLGISITLTIDTGTVDTSISNIARNRVVESINTRSTRQAYAIAKNLRISITLTIDTGSIDTSVPDIARHWMVESIYTKSTLQPYAIAKNLGICLGGDSSNKGSYDNMEMVMMVMKVLVKNVCLTRNIMIQYDQTVALVWVALTFIPVG
jgi:hypothetical protein